MHVFLSNQLLSRVSEHALLLPMIFKLVLVLYAFLGSLSKYEISFTEAIPSLHFLLLLLFRDCLIQFVTVALRIDNLLDLFVGLVSLIRFSLSLDDGAPFV